MADGVRLTTEITTPVNRRLRVLAALKRQSLSHVLTELLDKALPPAEELAGLLSESEEGAA